MNQDLKIITDKLDDIKGTMDKHITATEIYREEQKGKITKLEYAVEGNGKPGLKTKVDRLERSEYIKNWILGSLFVAIIPILISYLLK